ncbi:MAG: U32 family peptidase [Clostridia bacterium]|nr:U32 family peptidase [Clostridia bacterium]
MMNQIELLAPAGDMEGLQTALQYGADAIYCGGPFLQLRAESAGFDIETLQLAADTVHRKGKKLFVTVNSFPENSEIEPLGRYAFALQQIGIDAVIVSDIGAICEIKNTAPDLEVHLSTQANCMNYKSAEVYHNLGVKRIVLARELSIEEIAEIRAKTPPTLELEAFVHGAMCMSYSGRCLISSFLTGRSANRGECTQSCRWNYRLTEEKRPGEYFEIEESTGGTAILSSKELCCIEFLDKLATAGISSFKIEGRMRTPYSIGVTVNAYRMAIDGSASIEEIQRELDTTSHRPYCSGFYLNDPNALAPDTEGYVRDWIFIAKTSAPSQNGFVDIQTRNHFRKGDTVEIISAGNVGRAFQIDSITNSKGESLQLSNTPMRTLTINCPYKVLEGDLIRKKIGK